MSRPRRRRIVLATMGSRGDVQPMLALALALRGRGHDAVFCAPPDFSGWITGHGFEFHGAGMDVGAFLQAHATAVVGRMAGLTGGLGVFRREVAAQFSVLARVAEGADAIVGASLAFAAASIAESQRVPYLFALFAPMLLRSREHPPFLLPALRLPGWLNACGWTLSRILTDRLLRPAIDHQRERLALPPIGDTLSHLLSGRLLLACDAQIAPLPADVRERCVQTGAWIMPPVAGAALTPDPARDLEGFIAAGAPPVYVGFGSMTDPDPVRTTRMVIETCTRLGRRLVLSRGWGGLGVASDGGAAVAVGITSGEVFVLGDAPHAAVFPRMAAVVHHGGSGTVATATRAGVPQAVVPHIADQFYWGERLRRIGVAPAPLPRSRLDVAHLKALIAPCLSDPMLAARARTLASAVAATRGVEAAVDEIEAAMREGVASRR